MAVGSLSLSSAQQSTAQRVRNAYQKQARRDPYWGRRDIETPWLPPVLWATGAAGTRANLTPYAQGMVLSNAAGTHQFLCVSGGTSAAAEPAGMTNPGNAAATPWGCGNITDGSATFVWYGAVRTTAAKVGAPAVSIGAVPASLTKTTRILNAQNQFFLSGGLPAQTNSIFGGGAFAPYFAANTLPSGSGSNMSYDDGTNAYNQTFGAAIHCLIDAPLIGLGCFQNPYSFPNNSQSTIEIDGLRVSDSPVITTPAIGTTSVVILDFRASAGRAERLLTLRQSVATAFYDILTTPADTIRFPDNPNRYRLGILGNSIVAGANGYPQFAGNGFGQYVAALLGCDDVWEDGTGGSGWTLPGTGYAFTHPNKMAWTARCAPDVLLVVSCSDSTTGPVSGAVLQWLAFMRARLPATIFVICGIFPGSAGPTAANIATENSIATAVNASGDGGTLFIPFCTDPAFLLVSGSGNIGATTGVGNADVLVQSDGVHPATFGNQMMGRRVVTRMMQAIG